MNVREIFRSIQGEGLNLGRPCVFIRTQGCNLSCPWCDTKETWSKAIEVKNLSPAEIVEQVKYLGCDFVVITGGEPTIQSDLADVVKALWTFGCEVAIETNGTNPTPMFLSHVACSPKPQSGYKIHEGCQVTELKYVVAEGFDDKVAIPEFIRNKYKGRIWLQPDGYNMKAMWARAYEIAQRDPRLRVGVQLHKIMEVK